MVDAHALGACGFGRAGSNPASPTMLDRIKNLHTEVRSGVAIWHYDAGESTGYALVKHHPSRLATPQSRRGLRFKLQNARFDLRTRSGESPAFPSRSPCPPVLRPRA